MSVAVGKALHLGEHEYTTLKDAYDTLSMVGTFIYTTILVVYLRILSTVELNIWLSDWI